MQKTSRLRVHRAQLKYENMTIHNQTKRNIPVPFQQQKGPEKLAQKAHTPVKSNLLYLGFFVFQFEMPFTSASNLVQYSV